MEERRKYKKGDIVKYNIHTQYNGYNVRVPPSTKAIRNADDDGYITARVQCNESWHPEVCLQKDLFEGNSFWVKASGVELVRAVDATDNAAENTIKAEEPKTTNNKTHTVTAYRQIKEILLSVKEALWNDSESYRAHIADNGGHASNFIITSTHDGSILFSASLIDVTSPHKARKLARAALACAGYDTEKIAEILGGKYNYGTPNTLTVTKYELGAILSDFVEEVVPSYIDDNTIKEFVERSMHTK